MRQAARFFLNYLVKDPATGWLISTPSNSPEHGGLVAGPTMDHQIIRQLFDNCIAASQVLNTDAAFRQQLKDTYRQIAPNQIGKYGQLQEWLQDIDDTTDHHRHVSHLWGVYPGADITWKNNPEDMRAARQSLLFRGDSGTGWSIAWKINLWARFKDGNHVLSLISRLLSPAGEGGGEKAGLYPICSMPIRLFKSTAISAPPPVLPKCCCKATTVASSFCRPYPPHFPKVK